MAPRFVQERPQHCSRHRNASPRVDDVARGENAKQRECARRFSASEDVTPGASPRRPIPLLLGTHPSAPSECLMPHEVPARRAPGWRRGGHDHVRSHRQTQACVFAQRCARLACSPRSATMVFGAQIFFTRSPVSGIVAS